MLRGALTLLSLVLLVLGSGCMVKAAPAPPTDSCADTAPLHVVIGVSGRNLSAATRTRVLKSVLDQLRAQVRPGSDGLVVSAYPLDDHSVASEPVRATIPCISSAPPQPDIRQTPPFERARALKAYQAEVARNNADADQARGQLNQFAQRLLAMDAPSTPTDIWGFLTAASDEFETVDAAERHVVIVARDEEIHSTYCDGCQDLRGADVHFVAFDLATPADEKRRRSDWSMWLTSVGAGNVTFTRSNEPVPSLFAIPSTSHK
jgi:hypothetical protein